MTRAVPEGEYSNTERERAKSSAQTLWRLVERRRADVLWELLDDPWAEISDFNPAAVLRLHRQETPNSVGGREVNVPGTSNSSHGTATDQV